MGFGLIDIDAKDCMMLRAHQSLSNKELRLRNKTMVDFYISVIKRYRKELLKLSTLIVADAEWQEEAILLYSPSLSVKRYFFITELGSKSNFAFATQKAILVLWTAWLATSGNSILLSMLRSHH